MSKEASSDPAIPAAFKVLGGHYTLVQKLGEGAFGVVYKARHDLLGQEFAVKLLKPELCQDANVRERFLDEARALTRFSHANVVQLRHVGEQEGRLYLVMDLVEGRPLDEVIREKGAFAEERAVKVILQVLEGLEAAHAAGIIHRDLKPSNLLIEEKPGGDRIRILDFGLSKLSAVDGSAGAHRSITGTIIGTLAYMSPEQISGSVKVDQRSDVFAAGLVLQEMLVGAHPYPGDSGIVVAAKILRDGIPPLDAKKAKNISPTTREALSTALERDRDARFPSAFAFAQALQGKGPPSDTSGITTVEHARQQLARAEAEEARKAALARSTRRKSSKAVLLVVGLLAAAGVGAFFAFGNKGKGGPQPTEVGGNGRSTPTSPSGTHPGTPNPGTTNPGTTDPGTTDPGTPGPGTPQPGTPEPGTPEPGTPEPGTPEPGTPEPGTPEPGTPEPGTPEPGTPEPGTPEPGTPEPGTPEPGTPDPGPSQPTLPTAAAGGAEAARALALEGRHAEAAATWRPLAEAEPADVEALRGTAESWISAADDLARSGKVTEALATYDQVEAWLRALWRKQDEESRRDSGRMREPLGFTLTFLGQTLTEKARWYAMLGRQAERDKAITDAGEAYRFAWQFLTRDGVSYWEFLLRRAEWHRLKEEYREYIDDLAITTQTDNTEVPIHMWVAHAAGLRHLAELNLARREPQRAYELATEALGIMKKGISWTRSKRQSFDRNQWLEAARVVFVNDLAAPPDEDRTSLNGLMGWYVSQAKEQPKPADESDALAQADLLTMEAAQAAIEARLAAQKNQADQAATRLADAIAKAREAVALRERLAASGGELPEMLPYIVLASALRQQGDDRGAVAAIEQARQAMLKNPE